MKQVEIKQNEENVISMEVLADNIVSISEGIKKLLNTQINRKTLLILIHEACPKAGVGYKKSKPSVKEIDAVLQGIENLKSKHLKTK